MQGGDAANPHTLVADEPQVSHVLEVDSDASTSEESLRFHATCWTKQTMAH